MLLNNKNTKRKEILVSKTCQHSTGWQNYIKREQTFLNQSTIPKFSFPLGLAKTNFSSTNDGLT